MEILSFFLYETIVVAKLPVNATGCFDNLMGYTCCSVRSVNLVERKEKKKYIMSAFYQC